MKKNILDRTIIPEINDLKFKGFPKYIADSLPNNIPWFGFHNPSVSIIRLELAIPGGSWNQSKILQAALSAKMLTEGTLSMPGNILSEKLDFLGAYIYGNNSRHFTNISMLTLKEKLNETLDIFQSVISEPAFLEQDFNILKENLKQDYIIESEKPSFIAAGIFPSLIYGKNHPYGYLRSVEDYDNINVSDLKNFYHSQIAFSKARIYISSCIEDSMIKIITDKIGSMNFEKTIQNKAHFEICPDSQKIHFIEKKNALQTSITIGKEVANKNNPDYPILFLANAILGGYFGSRLMTNIREEKGLTYGIYSRISPNIMSAMFTIKADVIAEKTNLAIDEIFSEIKRLTQELVSEEELQRVKNYVMGSLIRSFDGPFNSIDFLQSMHSYMLDENFYYDNFTSAILNATAIDIQYVIKKYLNPDDMYVLTVGPKI